MMPDGLAEQELSVNPTDRPAQNTAHWLYGALLFALALFLLANLPFQTSYFEGVVWSKQPALWPGTAIAGMLIAGAGHLLVLRRKKEHNNALPFALDLRLLLSATELAAWFVAYVYIVGYLGYLPSSLLFALFLGWRVGCRSFRQLASLLLAAVIIAVTFKAFLKVKIPGGRFYDLMPDSIARFFNIYF